MSEELGGIWPGKPLECGSASQTYVAAIEQEAKANLPVAVAVIGGDVKGGLLANLHLGNALVPTCVIASKICGPW